jgi:hypothetical protein
MDRKEVERRWPEVVGRGRRLDSEEKGKEERNKAERG